MGDFYEMFFDDAKDAAPLLGIALTRRHRDSDIEAPMCGVPHHGVDHHVAKLGGRGPQGRDLRPGRGRTRGQGLSPPRHHPRGHPRHRARPRVAAFPSAPCYLAALAPAEADWGVAFLDLSTGRFHAGLVPAARVDDALALFRPREILLAEGAAAAGVFGGGLAADAEWWNAAGAPSPDRRCRPRA